MYENLRDADFRLRGTVVWYDGKYVFVENVERISPKVYTLNVTSNKERFGVTTDNPKLKIRNIPQGYVNINGRVAYVKRLPTRTYRQGLRRDNCTILGSTFDSFLQDVKVGGHALEHGKILSPDYCAKNGNLYYRGRKVGVYVDGKPYLDNSKRFLSELLESVVGGGE